MMKKVRAVQYGCGKMGKFLIRYLQEHGAEVVAAFDINPAVIGKDIGEIAGTATTGVKIQPLNEADKALETLKPDVGIIATLSTMADLEDAFSLFARHGVNAISTGEEALYPWNSSPEITEKLDALAKANNCTLAGSGYPDMFWGVLIDTLAGSMHKLVKIKGSSCYNVEDYGIALAKGHGAGLTVDEFNQQIGNYNDLPYAVIAEKIESGEYAPPYMWTQNGWLCSRLGLAITSQTQRCVPQIAKEDIYSDTLKMTVKKGDVLGLSAVVITETAEGVTLETECIGKILTADECDKNSWQLIGEPDTAIEVNNPATVELTCANLVNRIPALINSPAGYTTTEKMPNNVYMTKPMHEYL
ncbi:dihydrodipicolinate reductase [Providencia alcalifaciens]|uniref:NAD(P)H-dependent amine dehydrogenase family protein n=1 Tax=Providencia alcalifaciens TaxID=126385 RepID=UPI001CC3B2F5|nr:dihydrodipicolinate reductase [Providencia alcalifaciens]CAG9428504.1 2,4-diaminopentanoate dehydrogenase [Providencia alcalifaciens]